MIDLIVKENIVDQIVHKFYDQYPELIKKFGENGKKRTREDNYYHLQYLETAFELHNEQVFIDYSLWLNEVLTSRGVGTSLIIKNFQWLSEAVDQLADDNMKAFFQDVLQKAIIQLNIPKGSHN